MMLPQGDDNINYVITNFKNKTYKISNDRILGFIDDKNVLEAIKQSIYCILNCERYQYLIYSFDYGVEIQNLIGKDKSFVYASLKQNIKEALLQDDRIVDVDNFVFNKEGEKIIMFFDVMTNYGNIKEYEFEI